MIRLTVPSIEEDDLKAVQETLISGYLVQGAKVSAFEQVVADYVGSKYAVAVSSCTAGLHISLLALGIRPGDIVLVTAYSWIATANVVELCGAKPIFVDICPDTFNMDPNCLEEILRQLMEGAETAGRIKAILPVHTFGQMADMSSILDLANKYELPVIEDAACALGASLNGRKAGNWGSTGCFSFHSRKAITTSEGGIITTNDSDVASRLRALRNHGQDPDAASPDFILPGFNYRMTEFQAALGLTQMRKLDRIIAARQMLTAKYDELLKPVPLKAPKVIPGTLHVYQTYVALLPKEFATKRGDIINRLKEHGIEANIGTLHMPLTSYFCSRYDFKEGDFPVADMVFARSMALPMHEHLTEEEQVDVVQHLDRAIDELGQCK